ncbi:transposase [Cellulomonas sp. P24]|uniref:transposase n=1 Tax=Cellulomonas sp. P24 TaxID=2885206 RepID=UPI00216B5CCC|nr:transposase [Cellulomonas sp. P24]MCR6492455.1 transposase [Cellulomonas sp. P24]
MIDDEDRGELVRLTRSSMVAAGLATRARIVLAAGSFRFSTDPELVAKVTDVVGPYLAPPQNSIVLYADEKSQIQASGRTAPVLPTRPHLIERRSADCVRAYPERELHLVMDNYAARTTPEVRDWLAANPRVVVHLTPTHASWMNLVAVWFLVIERQAIHRGTDTAVKDPNAKIRTFIDGGNDRAHPFIWTAAADDILKKANRKTTSDTRH